MKINLKNLIIIKRMINLNVDINKEIKISSLNVLNDYFYNFKLNAFKIIFNEILFEIEMKLNKKINFF